MKLVLVDGFNNRRAMYLQIREGAGNHHLGNGTRRMGIGGWHGSKIFYCMQGFNH